MRKFFSKKMDELTVLDTIVYSFVVSVACFAPLGIYAIGCGIVNVISNEIKSRKEDEEE